MNNLNELILKLSESEYISVVTDHQIDFAEVDFCCGEMIAYFVNEYGKLNIGEQTAGEFFEPFIRNLTKSINGKL